MSLKTFIRSPDGTLDIGDSLIDATSLMRFDRRACFLVRDRGMVIGLLTPADVRAAGPSLLPTLGRYEHSSCSARLTVANALRGNAIVVSLEATPVDVARALQAGSQRGAIVTDGPDVVDRCRLQRSARRSDRAPRARHSARPGADPGGGEPAALAGHGTWSALRAPGRPGDRTGPRGPVDGPA